MMKRLRHLLKLRKDTRGATLTEFGFVILPLSLLAIGALDLGYRMYLQAVLQGVVHQAGRESTIEGTTQSQLDTSVRSKIANVSPYGTVTIERANYAEFTGVGQPEPITQDTAPVGDCNPGDWYLDENNNGNYDLDMGVSGQGGADDVIRYQVTVDFPRMVRFGNVLGTSDTITLSANTVMQNQPYAAQTRVEPVEKVVSSCP